jgi:hypothetical protein
MNQTLEQILQQDCTNFVKIEKLNEYTKQNMNKEELIQFLKDNLKIEIKTEDDWDYYAGTTGVDIEITLKIGYEVINTSTNSVRF